MGIAIHRLEDHIGAEVERVDITAPIDEETFLQLRNAFYEHAVLVFHDQDIRDAQHVTCSKGFGPICAIVHDDPSKATREDTSFVSVSSGKRPSSVSCLEQSGILFWFFWLFDSRSFGCAPFSGYWTHDHLVVL